MYQMIEIFMQNQGIPYKYQSQKQVHMVWGQKVPINPKPESHTPDAEHKYLTIGFYHSNTIYSLGAHDNWVLH